MSEMGGDHPIYQAIDKGGGQVCDIRGVIRELNAAGYVIVPRVPTREMVRRTSDLWPLTPEQELVTTPQEWVWQTMIDEALK